MWLFLPCKRKEFSFSSQDYFHLRIHFFFCRTQFGFFFLPWLREVLALVEKQVPGRPSCASRCHSHFHRLLPKFVQPVPRSSELALVCSKKEEEQTKEKISIAKRYGSVQCA